MKRTERTSVLQRATLRINRQATTKTNHETISRCLNSRTSRSTKNTRTTSQNLVLTRNAAASQGIRALLRSVFQKQDTSTQRIWTSTRPTNTNPTRRTNLLRFHNRVVTVNRPRHRSTLRLDTYNRGKTH